MFHPAAMGSLQIIKEYASASAAIAAGMNETSYKQLVKGAPWTAPERAAIRDSLERMCHTSIDLLGLPRFELPAEYVATVIAVFVHPVNIAVACSWMAGRLPRSMDLHGSGDTTPQGMEHLSSAQLFAMVLDILGNEDTGAVARAFNRHMSKVIEDAATNG